MDDYEQPRMTFWTSVLLITIVITVCAFFQLRGNIADEFGQLMTLTAEYFVASIDGVTQGKLTKKFVGMVLLPVVGSGFGQSWLLMSKRECA